MRALRLSAVVLLTLPSLLACPSDPPVDAGVLIDAGPQAAVDAGLSTTDGGVDAGFAAEDAGDVDAGFDGGPADAGFVCEMPDIPVPADAGADAGPPDCALDDTEGSTGYFEGTWEGVVFGSFPLTGPFELSSRGEMAFEIYCGDDKLLVDGLLEGRAYEHPDAGPEEPGHPFSGRLYGEYSLATGVVTMVVNPATLQVGPFTGTFQVAMNGYRENDAFEDGSWCGVTISPEGGAGDGTWRADLIR